MLSDRLGTVVGTGYASLAGIDYNMRVQVRSDHVSRSLTKTAWLVRHGESWRVMNVYKWLQ